ncbi:hypothetical protein [Alienimonas californiensis]|uniref:DUF4878 domain-containing protein n=1 Tax=Alienimonas californiensis TaxID=2527989 RepID=A0A517P3P6_9PLAN|nr:hypothetical protein [Alienimonas californiensis]QDT13994.1 hypothetical protein CA12_00620 [Alienimonas californiensis]
MQFPRRLAILLCVVSTGLLGCDEPDPLAPAERTPDGDVRGLIDSIPDLAGDAKSFGEHFVGGKLPEGASAKDYFYLRTETQSVEVTGDRATAQVAVGLSEQFEAEAGPPPVEWVLVKQGDTWLLESAPLP